MKLTIKNNAALKSLGELPYNTVVNFRKHDEICLVVYAPSGPNNRGLVSLEKSGYSWYYDVQSPLEVLGTLCVEK